MNDTPRSTDEELAPQDVRRIRELLGLSQVEAGELLGGGPRAFQKYEAGTVKPAATTANLLRLLEANPAAVGTLTGARAPPIQAAGLGPFEVSGQHVVVLNERYLVQLVRRLASAEAQTFGIPSDRLHVASNLTAPDGGVDARITWQEGPDRTSFLPARDSIFQVKATDVSPSAAGKDVLTSTGSLEPGLHNALQAGGAYLMLVGRCYTQDQVQKREDAIRAAFVTAGIAEPKVAFRDADQIAGWVNQHPAVAIWLLELTQPGLATTLRTWKDWAQRHEHEGPFVDDPRLEPVRSKVREILRQPRLSLRIIGASGLGKSRLALEALAPDDDDDGLSALVLYGIESDVGRPAVKAAVQVLADTGKRAVVVIDRCEEATHFDLDAIIKRSGSRLSLLTLDHEIGSVGDLPTTIKVGRADDKVIEAIFDTTTPGLPTEDKRRLVRFADGYPRLAVLTAEAWSEDRPLGSVTRDDLIEQVVVGRFTDDRSRTLKAAKALSVFGLLGYREHLADELAAVGDIVGMSVQDLQAGLADLVRRGVAQLRGRLVTLQPRPIALSLAARQWQEWGPSRWDELLTAGPPGFPQRLAKQLCLLNTEPFAAEVARSVCRFGGPLDTYQALQLPANASVVEYLAQIETAAVATLLERLLAGPEPVDLRALESDARREIVRAVERVAFDPETFEIGAQLMLQLALAENEDWGNNATGQFTSLFPVLLADTAATGDQRLQFLDGLIGIADDSQEKLIVAALDQGAKVDHFTRSVGSESFGMRPAFQPWTPNYEAASAYITGCIERLASLGLRASAVGATARQALAQHFRALVSHGFLDPVEVAVANITSVLGSYWPEAMAGLGEVISYDLAEVPQLEDRVRALIAQVTPQDLDHRILMIVTEMPWDFPCDEKLDFELRETRQREAVFELAGEVLATQGVLAKALPDLSRGSQRMAGVFGEALAQLAQDPEELSVEILQAFVDTPAEQRNPDLLTSYLAELAKTNPAFVEGLKDTAAADKGSASLVPLIAWKSGFSPRDIERVCEALDRGFLEVRDLHAWTFGGRLAQLVPAVVAPLFDRLFGASASAPFGFDLLGMYVHGRRERLEELRPQIRRAADAALAKSQNTMTDHHFTELMGWMLNHGRADADARAVALTLSRALTEKADLERLSDERRIRPLLGQLLQEFPEVSWPLIGQAIAANPKTAWRFEFLMGRGTGIDGRGDVPILSLPADTLFAWCHAHPDVAPAFVAKTLPLLGDAGEGGQASFHPLIRRLLDEFGHRDDVRSQLNANMYTFGWSGSLSTYYERYRAPLAGLADHPVAAVRKWAKRTSQQLESQIRHELNSDEERSAAFE